MKEITINKNNFVNEVLNSEVPVVVDFWASWCGPCRMLSPVIAELANEANGRFKVGKVNVDEENELAMKFNIVSIPTVLLFKNGQVVSKALGFRTKEQLKSALGI